jgi:hypothetical protein
MVPSLCHPISTPVSAARSSDPERLAGIAGLAWKPANFVEVVVLSLMHV